MKIGFNNQYTVVWYACGECIFGPVNVKESCIEPPSSVSIVCALLLDTKFKNLIALSYHDMTKLMV